MGFKRMKIIDQLVPNSPCSWHWYLFSALLIDTLLGREVSEHAWLFACALVLLLVYMTARRFADIGWGRWWAIPYALFTLCPYAVLFLHPEANVRLITLVVVLLQVLAMVWPKKKTAVTVAEARW
jgi:hypothetical protein